jgi:hypothetical protein
LNLPVNKLSQNITVKRDIPGHNDDSGQWVEGGEVLIASIVNANIQPKSGRERASQSGTIYESDYKMFAGTDDITWESGYSMIEAKDIIIDSRGIRHKVIFPGLFPGHHYESDLKLEATAG